MKVSQLGEFGLVNLLAKMVSAAQDKQAGARQHLIIGIGDDAAAWHVNGSILLATIDSLRENIHFSLDTISWEELGWKALAVNLSDIAAMGGLPQYALVSLAVPADTDVENVTALYSGMLKLAQEFDVAIVGGDTDSAPLVEVAVTVIGTASAAKKELLTRSTAKPGDKIAVTGYLGAAAAGLQMLTKHLQFNPETTISLKKALLQPYPRVKEGQLLLECGVKTAVDISDGLISDLGHICQASQVGARIEIERVPIHPATKANFGDKALELALSGGEDYELLFTASTEAIEKVKKAVNCPVTVIGEIIADKTARIALVDSKGKPFNLSKTGWEHFTMGKA